MVSLELMVLVASFIVMLVPAVSLFCLLSRSVALAYVVDITSPLPSCVAFVASATTPSILFAAIVLSAVNGSIDLSPIVIVLPSSLIPRLGMFAVVRATLPLSSGSTLLTDFTVPLPVPVALIVLVASSITIPSPAVSLFCFLSNASCVAVLMGLSASEVLSTLPKPTEALVNPVTEISFVSLIAIFVPAVSLSCLPAKLDVSALVASFSSTCVAVYTPVTDIVLLSIEILSPAVSLSCLPSKSPATSLIAPTTVLLVVERLLSVLSCLSLR